MKDVSAGAEKTRVAGRAPVVDEVIEIDPFTVIRFERQPRGGDSFDPAWITKLAKNMKKRGQRTPVLVTPYTGRKAGFLWLLVDGENRTRAAKEAGIKLRAIVMKSMSEKQHFLMAATANFFRQSHSPTEIAGVVREFREDGMTWEEIEDELGMTAVTLREYHDLCRLDPSILARVNRKETPRGQRISVGVASELSKLPKPDQRRVVDSGIIDRKPAAHAIQYIRQEAKRIEAAGGEVHRSRFGRQRRPSDDADMAETHITRARNEIGLVLGMREELRLAFQHRRIERNTVTIDQAIQLRNEATRLLKELGDIMPKNYKEAVRRATT